MDASTFKKSVMPYHKAMYRIAYSVLGDVDDAADAVQETMIALWSKRDALKNVESLERYCLTSVKYHSISLLRRRKINIEITEAPSSESDYLFIEDNRRIEDKDRLSYMAQKMQMLPENFRKVLRLRAYGELTMEEISQVTGLSDGNVRVLLSRARKKLKELCTELK